MTVLLAVAAVACVALAVMYFTTSASSLPSVAPGHDAASTRHHVKHGIAMLGLAVLALVGAWFTTGPSDARTG
ncbi:MAG: hypothetical protein ABR511_13665 [Acidimicrobiales bacterium]